MKLFFRKQDGNEDDLYYGTVVQNRRNAAQYLMNKGVAVPIDTKTKDPGTLKIKQQHKISTLSPKSEFLIHSLPFTLQYL